MFEFILASLFTFRLSYMLAEEDGPFCVFDRLRVATRKIELLDCAFCVSVWVALLPALLIADGWFTAIVWLAISASSMFMYRLFELLE